MVPVIHCGASSARYLHVWSKQALGETPKSRTLSSCSYSAAKAGPIIREARIIRYWVMVVVFLGGFAMKRKGKVEEYSDPVAALKLIAYPALRLFADL